MSNEAICRWLMDNSGPIIRYRTAFELMERDDLTDYDSLRNEALTCNEAKKWIGLLDHRNPPHGPQDHAFETVVSKLNLYGLHTDIPQIRGRILPYIGTCQ